MELVNLTLIILSLNRMLDLGKYDDISVDQILERIRDGSVLQFLADQARGDVDFSLQLARPHFVSEYLVHLRALLDAYGGGGKWGVKQKGVCLLLAWTNEIVQQGSGWEANPRVAR